MMIPDRNSAADLMHAHDSPANAEAASLYRENRKEYNKKVKSIYSIYSFMVDLHLIDGVGP